jgi:polysaccharide export outer membrane protein
MHYLLKLLHFPVVLVSAMLVLGQSTSAPPQGVGGTSEQQRPLPQKTSGPERVAGYVLGPEDQIIIRAFQAEEISDKPFEIGGDGYINVPMVGRIRAAGLRIDQLESELTAQLGTYIQHPQVTVLVSDYHSQPISVVGAVNNPGVIQLKGRKTLVEVIALAGGLHPDAGNTATITRELSDGRTPLPHAEIDPGGKISITRVNLRKVMDAQAPEDNVVIETNDVVTIPRALMVYVVGEVQKPGGFVLNERDTVSVLQALSLAGGLTANAAPKKAKILRGEIGKSTRIEVASDLHNMLGGKAPDIPLHADDILFVPNSVSKSAGRNALQAVMGMAGAAIWRIP